MPSMNGINSSTLYSTQTKLLFQSIVKLATTIRNKIKQNADNMNFDIIIIVYSLFTFINLLNHNKIIAIYVFFHVIHFIVGAPIGK